MKPSLKNPGSPTVLISQTTSSDCLSPVGPEVVSHSTFGHWLYLLVYGNIDSGFYDHFRAALDANPGVESIGLRSADGSVADALLSGLEIRKRGLRKTVHGPCFSACPLVFISGGLRAIWENQGSHLGFYRVYTP